MTGPGLHQNIVPAAARGRSWPALGEGYNANRCLWGPIWTGPAGWRSATIASFSIGPSCVDQWFFLLVAQAYRVA